MVDELKLLRDYFDAHLELESAIGTEKLCRALSKANEAKAALLQAADNTDAQAVHVVGTQEDGGKTQ